ncbi:hypothetical protein COL05_11770 [Bacillus sp. AFS059628]|uniref:hypothetical protein n=1 Tax=Bacillus sp. AFS059628 TaxID=2033508 RepID=UPI000BF3E8E7|nr:hypothetical protein [Bacillus sp. AFS059628]PFV82175.1 hypothetical protein COL05_11770 [Bacillus sp. AFS059628]
MRTFGIISLVVIALLFFNVISLHAIGTLSLILGLLMMLLSGAYFLYHIVFSFLALFTTIKKFLFNIFFKLSENY